MGRRIKMCPSKLVEKANMTYKINDSHLSDNKFGRLFFIMHWRSTFKKKII